jgi:hypothetical protein
MMADSGCASLALIDDWVGYLEHRSAPEDDDLKKQDCLAQRVARLG